MKSRSTRHWIQTFAVICGVVTSGYTIASSSPDEVLARTGFPGGIAVQVGGDGSLLRSLLEKRPNMLGHLLVADGKKARIARQTFVSQGLHGKLTVSEWNGGQLPFVPDFVNLLVTEYGKAPGREEILRVLAPAGKALTGDEVIEKPRPGTMDDWPMMFYEASGNAVSKDKIKPPLKHMQWVGGPRWSRHHDTMSSVSACVSGDNKLFYIFDEGLTFSPYLPSRWKLIARDAFNGVVLWKLPIDEWVGNLYRLKNGPATLPRRVVADGKVIYATLGIEAPVSVIDTTTGEVLRTLTGTEGTEEIVNADGYLYLVADLNEEKPELDGPRPGFKNSQWFIREKQVLCVDPGRNKVLWQKPFEWVAPLTLSLARGRVFFYDGKAVTAISEDDGGIVWKSQELPVYQNMPTYFGPKLVVKKGVVMYSGGEDYVPHNGSIGKLFGLSMESGETMWTAPHPASGYQSPEDLFIVDGQAWAANVTANASSRADAKKRTGEVIAVRPSTGSETQRLDSVDAYWFHHRCNPGKSTEDYMILNRTGTEFVDYETGEWTLHHWVRGACLFGTLPANNLMYFPQHPCGCYIGAKMFGFSALGGANPTHITHETVPDSDRLTTFQTIPSGNESGKENATWPTYRGDLQRSGYAPMVKTPSKKAWSVHPGGKLTQPVVAGGKVIVSCRDNPTVIAYDAATGTESWRFNPGAQVDSSPALYEGRVYFGSAAGFIHCLALETGAELWRYQAAPTGARHMYFEKIESTHPVHGNVLVMNDRVYTVVGRSMFLDGGMRFLILDAATGEKIIEKIMNDKVPGTDEPLQMKHEILSMPMALPDILSTNGEKIFMRFQPFDLEGNRLDLIFDRSLFGLKPEDYDRQHVESTTDRTGTLESQRGEDAHLFSSTGFLDDSWWHRTYWIYGKANSSGHGGYFQAGKSGAPAGRMIAFDDDQIYTWGRMQRYFRWSEEYVYHLHAKDRDYNEKWSVMSPILVRAMLADDEKLLILGPDELMRQHEVKQAIGREDVQAKMAVQEEAILGKRGSSLLTVDKTSGKFLAGLKLESVPELDGMSSAYGRLYVVTIDGTLTCLGDQGQPLPKMSAAEIEKLNANATPPTFRKPKKGKGNKGKKSATKKKKG